MVNHDDSNAAIIAECVVALNELQELLATTRKCLAQPLTAATLLDAAAQHFQVLRVNVDLLVKGEKP